MILWVLGLLFLWFGVRLFAQYMMSIVPSADGFSIRGLRSWFFDWGDLERLKLAYYAPIRRRHAGWYRLTLGGHEGTVRLDSTMDGFDDLLRSALKAAAAAKLILDPSTRENVSAWASQDSCSISEGVDMTLE